MPQTQAKSSGCLAIQVDGSPKPRFSPGDVIIGRVQRTSPIVSPRARVSISLHGRAKSRLVVHHGQSSTVYRGRFQFFDDRQNVYQLFDGPCHIEAGSQSDWPFAVTVPTSLNHGVLTRGNPYGRSFLPLTPGDVANHPLPSTFSGGSSSVSAFVEYFLHAKLWLHVHDSTEFHEAILPIAIWNPWRDPPITEFKLRRHNIPYTITSQRLVPGMEDAKLSISQKTQKFFGSSKVPVLNFVPEISIPTVIQIENPKPFPFLIRINPVWSKTSEIIRNVPQKVRLTHIELHLKEDVEIKCDSFSSRGRGGSNSHKRDLRADVALRSLGKDVYIPCVGGGSPAQPLDLGNLLNFRLGYAGMIRQISVHPHGIYPDFMTYNIRNTHRLKWEVHISVANEVEKFRGEQMVTILPPSDASWVHPPPLPQPQREESWIHPPAEDVLPSFAEAQSDKRLR